MQNIDKDINLIYKHSRSNNCTRIFLMICVISGMICCQADTDNDFKSKGIITGPDLRMCICCGGWRIAIEGETYNFDSLPVSSDINLQKETFPINVKLDWVQSTAMSCPKWIEIQKIIKE